MKKTDFILVFDFGTSNVRAGLFSPTTGEMALSKSCGYRWLNPVPGQVELDPEEIWEASVKSVGALLQACGPDYRIHAISFSFFGDNVIPVDGSGNKLYNLLPAFDSRSKKEANIIEDVLGADLFYEITGGTITPMLVASKILWLKDKHPDIFEKTEQYFSIQQYILNKLGFSPVNDYSMAARKMLYDDRREWWSEDLADLLGISDRTLGEIVPSGLVLGEIKSYGSVEFQEEVPVLVGAHDTALGIMGLGATSLENGFLADVMGTFNCVGCYSHFFPKKTDGVKELQVYRGPSVTKSKNYVVVGAIPTGGALLEWFVNEVYPERDPGKDKFAALFEKIEFNSQGNLFTVPAFDLGQGIMYGFDLSVDRLDMFKSIVEGVTFRIKDIVAECDLLFNQNFKAIYCGGGGSKSSKWLQLISNVTAKAVNKVQNEEASALGAAIIAATSVGFYENVEEAVAEMVAVSKEFRPENALKIAYEDKYKKYKQVKIC